MSHSVTIQTRTVTSGSPSSINTGFCRTWPGLLKLAEVILGIVALVMIWMHIDNYHFYSSYYFLFFISMVVTFLITTTILVLSYTCSFTTETIISKTTFEVLYHACGFALLLISSILVLVANDRRENGKYWKPAAIVGLINSVIYLLSTIFALRVTRSL